MEENVTIPIEEYNELKRYKEIVIHIEEEIRKLRKEFPEKASP